MKLKFIYIFFIAFFLGGCQFFEDRDPGVMYLEYPNETIELKGYIGENVVVPEYIVDDYVFIGWTDGEDYYLGLTEMSEASITLTPEFKPIEDMFEKVEVSMGQANLINYNGDSLIVGLPTYWRGYLVTGFSSLRNDLTKLYLPSSIQKYNYSGRLTDLVVYGDVSGHMLKENMIGNEFTELISSCTYKDGTSINNENPTPGVLNDECIVSAIIKRNDEDAVFIPGKGTFYTFDVITSGSFYDNYFFGFGEKIRYLSFSQMPKGMFNNLSKTYQYRSLEKIEIDSTDLIVENNMYFTEDENGKYLMFVLTNEEHLKLDAKDYSIMVSSFTIIGNVKTVEIKNSPYVKSIDDLVYSESMRYASTEDIDDGEYVLELIVYPMGNDQTTYTFPENMISIRNDVLNFYVETIHVNKHYKDVNQLYRHFPNLETIHVPDDHPFLVEEDGVIYDKDMTHILFVNESNLDLVIKDSVKTIWTHISQLNSIHLNEGVSESFVGYLNLITDLGDITIDSNNPYMMVENGVIYNKDKTEILYIQRNVEELFILDSVISIGDFALNMYYPSDLKAIHINDKINADDALKLSIFSNLETVTVDDNNPYVKVIDNVVYANHSVDPNIVTDLLFVPMAADITEVFISEHIKTINFDSLNNNRNIQSYVVSEQSTNYKSIDGIIYDSLVTDILAVPSNYPYDHYNMPDTLGSQSSNYYDILSQVSSITIGENYVFQLDLSTFNYKVDPVLSMIYHFNNIQINPNSDYFNSDYQLITSLEGDLLYAFVGNQLAYEIPSTIQNVNPFAFDGDIGIEHLTVHSNLVNLPANAFGMDSLKDITILGDELLQVEGFATSELIDELGDNYIYYFASTNITIYVEAGMLEAYNNHPFWSLYEIKVIE